ncbi:MAG TPA: DUF3307 domain-containing protein [Candidatus Cloacimonas sp.]|jgi:hypothetical protein|nr:DUF3307 domain-containing protein [Candidatus Cloacimonas sp.]HPS60719.1 DUF3307 domain-containing protein [Candidatus Cloacimonas sp.]
MLLWRLLLALFVSDFLLQNGWLIKSKKYIWGLVLHCLIYLAVMLIFTANLLSAKVILTLLILAFLHGVVDYGKNLLHPLLDNKEWLLFLVDQIIHIITVILAVWFISLPDRIYILSCVNRLFVDLLLQYLILFTVTVFGGIFFTDSILKVILKEVYEKDNHQYQASRLIGMSERFLITIAVLIGHYELIGFLIAAKSLMRLPEIQDRNTENYSNYILVGTLVSYSWALSIALLFNKLL